MAGRLLRDRDRRGETGDAVNVGPGQLAEELPGKRGEALDVATLPFGVERVEGEARLARAAHAGEADEPAAGQADRHIAEVMLAGTADDDRGNVHGQTFVARTGRGGDTPDCSALAPRRMRPVFRRLDSPGRVPYDQVSRGNLLADPI